MSSTPLLGRQNNNNSKSTSSLRNYQSVNRNPVKYQTANPTQFKPAYNASSSVTNQDLLNHQKNRNRQKHRSTPPPKGKSNEKLATKLGTMDGVTLPTILNVLSILMFLRFGFILGQMGILGTILLLLLSYGIDLLTTLSVSAIATNGIVKGGGAYYMLSRSLGVEFGGAIGVIFYIGQILNSSMNVAGLIEPILFNFNENNGVLMQFLPVSYWWQFFYCSALLFFCIVVALTGASAVSNCGKYLCIILILSTISVPISAIFVKPFESEYGIQYTGLSFQTFKDNLFPNFTKGAAGSQLDSVENFNDLFGIFFPATAGILAGASMSGDLKNPSKSIPKGTLNGLLITFLSYFVVILSMGSSIPRNLLYKDTQVLQTINLSPFIILAGEFSTSIFSIIVGIVGAAKLLQAIARDEILPGIKLFGHGDRKSDDPKEAILLTWLICQLFLFADLNQIATFITMAFLMTFIVTNLACLLLKLGSAPNFRPSFKYFSTKTALFGTISCLIAMFLVDGLSACIIFATLILLILFLHFISPPKSWGDVSQSLIYHQVRKYLLKLRQDNVKYWRPQILLLVDNPRTAWKLILFCNNLKKGGLYVLGHVFLSSKFQDNINELRKNKDNWAKIREISKIKAFIQTSISPSFAWGVRNIFLGCGLGGMKPNITIVGFYDLSRYKGKISIPKDLQRFESTSNEFSNQVKIDINDLPTDSNSFKFTPKVKITEWIEILEDLSLLNSNIAVAKGFPRLNIPDSETTIKEEDKKYIDLYPIQMAQMVDNTEEGILTTNFDICTLILQMGAILHTVPNWKKTHKLRVVVFVEEEKDVKEEEIRVKKLLEIIRLQDSEILIMCLETAKLGVYNYLAKGDDTLIDRSYKLKLHRLLKEDEWWNELCNLRGVDGEDGVNKGELRGRRNSVFDNNASNIISLSVHINKNMRRMTMSTMNQLGINYGNMSFQPNRFSTKDLNALFTRERDYSTDNGSDYDSLSIRSDGSSINQDRFLQDKPQLNKYYQSSSSLRKMKKSAFTADRLPDSTINENAEGNEASIMFYDGDGEDVIEGGEEGKLVDRNNKNSEFDMEYQEKNMEYTSDPVVALEQRDPVNVNVNVNVNVKNSDNSNLNGNTFNRARPQPCGATASDKGDIAPLLGYSGSDEGVVVKFGAMTRRCQFLVLNDMMRRTSNNNATDLIMSTLPVPEIGLHQSEIDCVDYVVDLEIWTSELPSVLLMNAKTVTVTTQL